MPGCGARKPSAGSSPSLVCDTDHPPGATHGDSRFAMFFRTHEELREKRKAEKLAWIERRHARGLSARRPRRRRNPSAARKRFDYLMAESGRHTAEANRLAAEHTDYGAYNRAVERSWDAANEAERIMRTLPEEEQEQIRAAAFEGMARGFVRAITGRRNPAARGLYDRLRGLPPEQVRRVQRELEGTLLSGWYAPGANLSAEELADLAEAAVDQHEAQDVDPEHWRALGYAGRREADEALIERAIRPPFPAICHERCEMPHVPGFAFVCGREGPHRRHLCGIHRSRR